MLRSTKRSPGPCWPRPGPVCGNRGKGASGRWYLSGSHGRDTLGVTIPPVALDIRATTTHTVVRSQTPRAMKISGTHSGPWMDGSMPNLSVAVMEEASRNELPGNLPVMAGLVSVTRQTSSERTTRRSGQTTVERRERTYACFCLTYVQKGPIQGTATVYTSTRLASKQRHDHHTTAPSTQRSRVVPVQPNDNASHACSCQPAGLLNANVPVSHQGKCHPPRVKTPSTPSQQLCEALARTPEDPVRPVGIGKSK